MLYNVEEDRL